MAKYVIEDTTLTNMADAIREKTGGTEPITPSNFATEIAGIQSGGDTTIEDGLVEGTLTEYSNDRVTNVGEYAFYHTTISKIDLPNVTSVKKMAFQSSFVQSLNLPKATSIGETSCGWCSSLQQINIPNVISIDKTAFRQTSLPSITLPKVTNVANDAFYENENLKSVDFYSKVTIATHAFVFCSVLETVILRSETMCTLSGIGVFSSTPIESGTGYIYVPDNLVDSYKSATNWSTYASQIKPISELEEN